MIADSAVVRGTWSDLLERDGQVLVLSGNDVTLLSPLASAAAIRSEGGVTVSDLIAHLEALFGAPPDGDAGQAVRAVIAELQERGIVSIDQ